MNNKISEVTADELLHKVEVTEGLQQVMMGSLRILDNLLRTPDQQEKTKKNSRRKLLSYSKLC